MKNNSTGLFTIIDFWTRRLSLSLLLVASLGTASWGQETKIVSNPTIKDNRVTVRVKVTDKDSRPVMGLEDTDFKLTVDGKPLEFAPTDWKSPEESVPPPAWVVVLLDFSGSMNQLDSNGTKRIDGAMEAIRQFVNLSSQRGGNTQISLVPFGVGYGGCSSYDVNSQTLDKFYPAGDFKLKNYIDNLASVTPCASTNLYEPLQEAVKFLGNSEDERFYVEPDSGKREPRLSIILLSDGYHNAAHEQREFDRLIKLLKSNPQITVHTLGYGFTPEQLGRKYKLPRAATRADVSAGKVPEEEFVDKKRLAEIAQAGNGIGEFSADADRIAENLQLFLNALLGEYEITFTQQNPERGKQHQLKVAVKMPKVQDSVESEAIDYRMTVFGRSLPGTIRLPIFLLILATMILAGVLPFYYWGQYLKKQAMEQ